MFVEEIKDMRATIFKHKGRIQIRLGLNKHLNPLTYSSPESRLGAELQSLIPEYREIDIRYAGISWMRKKANVFLHKRRNNATGLEKEMIEETLRKRGVLINSSEEFEQQVKVAENNINKRVRFQTFTGGEFLEGVIKSVWVCENRRLSMYSIEDLTRKLHNKVIDSRYLTII